MYVRECSLRDFRSYETLSVAFPPGIGVLVGSNGQGKTNLVEALAYVATLSSHRVAGDAPLIRRGAESAAVRAVVSHEGRDIELEIELVPQKSNRAKVNRSPVKKPRDILGYLNVVVFAPEDLTLVKGDPSDRRHFLDQTLIAMSPRLSALRSDLDRVLKQRNALLKTAQSAARANSAEVMRTLDVWDGQLAHISAELVTRRLHLVDALQPIAREMYAVVSDDRGPFGMHYEPSLEHVPTTDDVATWEAAYLDALAHRRKDEIDRGITLVGPHRDELHLELRDLPVKGYASHGESWSSALTLRLATFELLRRDRPGGDPVLILDDVFAELDTRRRQRLIEIARTAEQTLVTAAVAEDVPAELAGARYDVHAGEVQRVL